MKLGTVEAALARCCLCTWEDRHWSQYLAADALTAHLNLKHHRILCDRRYILGRPMLRGTLPHFETIKNDRCERWADTFNHVLDENGRCECGVERRIELHGSGRSAADQLPDFVFREE